MLLPDAKFTNYTSNNSSIFNGGFSCQTGTKNTFGRIPMDQTIEENTNKDTQTAGGTKGFSTKTNDHANYARQLRSMVSKENYKFMHPDMAKGRII